MKTLSIVCMCTLVIGLQSCKGQTSKIIEPTQAGKNSVSQNSKCKPNVNIKVDKEYDSKGNLIRFDSTYTYVYKAGTEAINDSLFPLNNFFGVTADAFTTKSNFFSNDSLLKKLFFEDEFFKRQSDLNQYLFDQFYPKTDSLRQKQMNYLYKATWKEHLE
jgi:hypothetical protein